MATNYTNSTTDETYQIARFIDSNKDFVADIESERDPTFCVGSHANAELADFLSRPVKIFDGSWAVGATFEQYDIRPWELFFSEPSVKKRIDNYYLLQCKLEVKIVINGMPFHYGRVLVSYEPWPDYNETTSRADVIANLSRNAYSVILSQRPHIMLNPTDCQGGTLVLPFFHLENAIKVTDLTSFQEMGSIDMQSFDDLMAANGATQNVNITMFARAIDVELQIPTPALAAQASEVDASTSVSATKRSMADIVNSPPTCGHLSAAFGLVTTMVLYGITRFESMNERCMDALIAQASEKPAKKKRKAKRKRVIMGKDEYQKEGVISEPASAVAKIAGMLETAPVIGPFAMATKLAAQAVGGIARIFGYSRPVVLDKVQYYKPKYASTLAATDLDETVTKLTVDSKQEITIDSRTMGLGGSDELSLKYITQKPSYVDGFPWATTDAPGDLLFNCKVNPLIQLDQAAGVHTLTPLGFASLPFRHWFGSIVFRFQVICSAMHNGRIRIAYDPSGQAALVGAEYNTSYNHIIDINQETDVEIEVAWGVEKPYLRTVQTCEDLDDSYYAFNVGVSADPEQDNGTLSVFVVNELTSPSVAPVRVNVWVSAGDDFKLRNPQGYLLNSVSYFPEGLGAAAAEGGAELPVIKEEEPVLEAQANETDAKLTAGDEMENHPVAPTRKELFSGTDADLIDQYDSIFYGESIESFRTLLRRYNYYRNWQVGTVDSGASNEDPHFLSLNLGCKPLAPGYNPNGPDFTVLGNPYAYCNNTLIAYLMPAYIAYRGSFRDKLFPLFGIDQIGGYFTKRDYNDNTGATPNSISLFELNDAGGPVQNGSAVPYNSRFFGNFLIGANFHPVEQKVTEVEWPFQTGRRFAFARNLAKGESRDTTNLITNTYGVIKIQAPGGESEVEDMVIVSHLTSVGEDFSLNFFLNVPVMYCYDTPTYQQVV